MKPIPLSLLVFSAYFSFAGTLSAQISISTPGQDVHIGSDGSVKARSDDTTSSARRKSEARVTIGGIADDANIEGVTIINDRVSIDGKDVPPNVTRYKSPKSGKIYLIERKGGAVSVSEAGGVK